MLVRNLGRSAIAYMAVILAGCQNANIISQASAQSKPKIVASYSVLCHFIDTIAEDTVDLTCLIEGGQDPHTYRPTPSDSQALEKAQIIYYGGYDFEPQIIGLIEAVDSDIPKIAVHEAVLTDPIMAQHHHHEEEKHGDHEHEEHEHEEHEHEEELTADPHIWHDVNNAIATVEYLQSSLTELNPNQAAMYLENSARLTSQLKDLHVWIQEQIATIPEDQRILVTTHDALNYYVKAYEFKEYKTLQGLSPDSAPSAADVKDLVTEIEQTSVPTIFVEATANSRVINNVAREAGVRVSEEQLRVDGLGEEGTDTDTYIEMMVNNTCAIAEGLGGNCQPFN